MPPDSQRLEFPQLYKDVMRVRQEVLVNARRGKMEDIASDLWDDSVSLHWVMYIRDHVDDGSIIPGEGENESGNKGKMEIPIGTIKVRPVIGMVRCCPFRRPRSQPRSSKPWRLTPKMHSQHQPENKKAIPPCTGDRTKFNYLQLSEPVVLSKYLPGLWVEGILVTAVIKAFEGHLPAAFFHDIFGRVIPLDEKTMSNTRNPAEVAAARRQWKDQIIEYIPFALQWSGLMCVHAYVHTEHWWRHSVGFRRDMDIAVWPAHDPRSGPYMLMLRHFEWVINVFTSRETPLHRLSKAQRELFKITPYHVGGMELVWWKVRLTRLEALRVRNLMARNDR